MRAVLCLSLLFISCHQSGENQTDAFANQLHNKEPNILVVETRGIINGNAKLIQYPYWDTTTTIQISSLVDTAQKTFLFFLGKYYITSCDMCMSQQIESVKELSKVMNIPVLFVTDNKNSREMAVFSNRHNLNKLFIFINPDHSLTQYDYTCLIAPIN